MPHASIELEIRGEIRASDIPAIEKRLTAFGFRLTSDTRRTSVMSFGTVSGIGLGGKATPKTQADVRCRITNGDAEIVAKIGRTDVHNRQEISHAADMEDMISFAQMFGAMGFFTKVGSKKTKNYEKGKVVVSIVQSPSGLAYVELEKMSDKTHERADHEELKTLAHELRLTLWRTRKEFLAFCDRLTKHDDWMFTGTEKDATRLRKEIVRAGSGRA